MPEPMNQAAHLVVSAQSVVTDLVAQAAEIQQAIERQQALIAALMPVAAWGPPDEDDDEPEPESPAE